MTIKNQSAVIPRSLGSKDMIPENIHLPRKSVQTTNFLSHPIKYIHSSDESTIFPKNSKGIKFKSKEFSVKIDDDLIFTRKAYNVDMKSLPPVRENHVYIVSKIVANLLSGIRNDFIYPGTHPDYDGAIIDHDKIVAVKRFRLPDMIIISDEFEEEKL
jgi:hypothetical protein